MHGGIKMKTILISIIMFFVFYSSGFAQTVEERIKILEDALKKQEETIKAQQKLIEDLKAEMKQVKPPEQKEVAQPKELLSCRDRATRQVTRPSRCSSRYRN